MQASHSSRVSQASPLLRRTTSDAILGMPFTGKSTAGMFGLLFLAMSYHGLFNLPVAAGGYAFIAAVVMPVVPLALIMLVQNRSYSRSKTQAGPNFRGAFGFFSAFSQK